MHAPFLPGRGRGFPRRVFLQQLSLFPGLLLGCSQRSRVASGAARLSGVVELPRGNHPVPVALPHFPERLYAYVWRNWPLVPLDRIASVVDATPAQIRALATSMGLPAAPRITSDLMRRSYITVIKRNWHLIPYEQLLALLDWDAHQLAYTLREDDFLWVKLGYHKPNCAPLRYTAPSPELEGRARRVAAAVQPHLASASEGEPLFQFVKDLNRPVRELSHTPRSAGLRLCYSFFALYGDPLSPDEPNPYPAGYLSQLADAGVNAVWLQAVLYKLAPFPWEPARSTGAAARLRTLRRLVDTAQRHGIRVFLYLNEPRAMPLRFFEAHPEYRGVREGEFAALCTSQPRVREYLTAGIRHICEAVPGLGGFFSISASENLSNCWSHHRGTDCPRCRDRAPAEVIAEVNRCFAAGLRAAGGRARPELIVWDWGWPDDWAEAIIRRLPAEATLMSVSEWSLPISRGGVANTVGEYSISSVGPGPRAQRHWAWARAAGLKVAAKIQAGNSWELSAVPYIPVPALVAQHALRLRRAGIEHVMLGWTLGGYPSPNLEVVSRLLGEPPVAPSEEEAVIARVLATIAAHRVGADFGPHLVTAWLTCSAAFREFPFDGNVVYNAPQQYGPANLLWGEPTGYSATMVGFPYDHLDGWRSLYPPEVFLAQLEKVAAGFEKALIDLRQAIATPAANASKRALDREMGMIEAAALHFRSTANQGRFVLARNLLRKEKDRAAQTAARAEAERLIKQEQELAARLYAIQRRDSRIGFEASNQYYYVPEDLLEKIVNCEDLLTRWLPRFAAEGEGPGAAG